MLAFGLAATPFFNELSEKLTEISVNLPQVESNTPIYIQLPAKPPEPETIVQNRKLSEYDLGGNFSNCNGVEENELRKCRAIADKSREFILNHFNSRKRGYVVYEWTGIDSGNNFHIFIEPDESGNWHIVERSEIYSSSFGIADFHQVKSSDIRAVKRKLRTEDTDRWTPGKHYLMFFDKDGKQIGIL